MKIFFRTILCIQIIGICQLFLVVFSSQIFAQANTNIKTQLLKIDFSFPKETDDVLLGRPTSMMLDEDNNIYICDYHLSTILKYSQDGHFIKSIGNSGKGPGEFTNQSKFTYSEENLYVIDQSNRRIQIINQEGVFKKSFIIKKIPSAPLEKENLIEF